MEKLIRLISIIGSARLIGLLIGFARFKILAIYLGPYGLGVIGQAGNLLLLANVLVLLGIRRGVTKYLGEFTQPGRQDKLNSFIYTTFSFITPITILGGFICFLSSSMIAGRIFDDSSFGPLIRILSLAIPFMAMTFMLDCFLQGAKDIKGYSLAYILRGCLSLAILLPLAMIGNLKGAVTAVALGAVISFLVTSRAFKKKFSITFRQLSLAAFDRHILAKVLKVGSVVFISAAGFNLSLLLVRSLIIHSLGMADQGIFQAAYGLVSTYWQFLAACLLIYVTAHLSQLKTDLAVTEEFNKVFRLGLLGFIPIGMVILIFKEPILSLLYTAQFARAGDILPVFVIGSFFRVISWMIGLVFIPLSRLRPFLFLQLITQVIYVILSFLLLPLFSLQGVMISYLASYAILSGTFYLYLKRSINFKFLPENRALFLSSLIALCLISLLTSLKVRATPIVGLGLLVIWLKVSITVRERGLLKEYLAVKWTKIFGKAG
jgi:PST family polysaccharide transporter